MRYIVFCALLFSTALAHAAGMWQTGRLDYGDGSSEISAFVDISSNAQLQVVLCSKNQSLKYRFTLVLPKEITNYTIVEAKISTGGTTSTAYAEAAGNSLEFQIDPYTLIALPDSPDLSIEFKAEDAQFLGLDERINVSMLGADLSLRSVASECTALCTTNGFNCQESLLSAILWPVRGFIHDDPVRLKHLCSKETSALSNIFTLTDKCKAELDDYYSSVGRVPLSFIYKLMHDEKGSYMRYKRLWNEAVSDYTGQSFTEKISVDDSDWYLLEYALLHSHGLKEYPKSFYDILSYKQDPTTLIYEIDNRYEMETLKYKSVLMRRVGSSLNTIKKIDRALKHWNEFYRQFSAQLPQVKQALALKPLMYRKMLLRLWHFAGMPHGLELKPEYAFIQGSAGRLTSDDTLEKKCSYFEGAREDQFFLGGADCLKTIKSSLRDRGLKTPLYYEMTKKYETFIEAWEKSSFNTDGTDKDALELPLGLTLLSALKVYGFGDYFLMRECISTRDNDICSFEAQRSYESYIHEFKNSSAAIAAVSQNDGRRLSDLNTLWQDYQTALSEYTQDLCDKGKIESWRADLMLGMASIMQTDLLLNASYDREELPDESLLLEYSDVADDGLVAPAREDKTQSKKGRTELVDLDAMHYMDKD